MKKLALFASLSILLFSCSKVKDGEFLITGKAKGIENGKVVILQTLDESGMQTITLDSVKVQNEQFEFKGKIAEPAIYSVMFQSQNAAIALIAEHGEINIEVYKDSIPSSKVSGTYNNDEFYKFNINLKKEQKIIQKEIENFPRPPNIKLSPKILRAHKGEWHIRNDRNGKYRAGKAPKKNTNQEKIKKI